MKSALVPVGLEGTGAGRFLGTILASVRMPALAPEPLEKSPEALLTRARTHVDAGDVMAAVSVLGQVEGPARLEISDWLKDASARLACDRAVASLAKY